MGPDTWHNKDREGSAQGAQEPGLLPKAAGQGVQVSSQTNQLHLQPGGAEAVVRESHRPATAVPFLDPEDEDSGLGGQHRCGCRDDNDDVRVQEVPTLKVCALRVSSCSQSRRLRPEARSSPLTSWPKGWGTILLSGLRKCQEVFRNLGKGPGTPHRHTKP